MQITEYRDISKMTGGILSIKNDELQMTIPKPNNEIYKTMAVAGNAILGIGSFFTTIGAMLTTASIPIIALSDSLIPTAVTLTVSLVGLTQICIGEDLIQMKENLVSFHNENHSMKNVFGTAVSTQKVFQATFQGTYFRPLYTFGASRLTGNFQHLSVKLQGTIS